MRTFHVKGGVNTDGRKDLTSSKEIIQIPIPELLHIPLQQHIGTPAVPIVKTGDYVLKGQLIADSKGMISAPIHAPTSGTVKRIADYQAPHPSGLPVLTLTLKTDGKDKWTKLPEPINPDSTSSKEIAQRVARAGIVGMGGATFPSAVKLNLGERYNLDMLVINGAECEPYLTCDDRLMQEKTFNTLLGIKVMMKALKVNKALVAIESNKPAAFNAMKEACSEDNSITIVNVPARYPMGSEKHLVQALTGRETPAAGLTADLGAVVHNVATAYAVYEAIYLGRPLISRVVTVSGNAITTPGNYQALIGTPVADLINFSGGLAHQPKQLLMGGPMMGMPIPSIEVPIVKGSSGILALSNADVKKQMVMPCIGCGSCVAACPCGLLPMDMASRIEHEDINGASDAGLKDCVSCGSCNYVCPSHIPLVQFFNYAKGRLKQQDIDGRNHDRIKVLAENRILREEKIKQEKIEQLAIDKLAKNADLIQVKTIEANTSGRDIS